MTDELTTAATAMHALADSLRAIADGDEEGWLRLLNSLDHAEAVYAATYAVSCMRELIEESVNRDPRRISVALRAHADGMQQDLITHQVRLMSRDDRPD